MSAPNVPGGMYGVLEPSVRRALMDLERRAVRADAQITIVRNDVTNVVNVTENHTTEITNITNNVTVLGERVDDVEGSIVGLDETLDGALTDLENKLDVGQAALDVNAGTVLIEGDKIVAGSITVDQLGANSVGSDQIVANSIIAGKLATDSVVAANIAAGQITTVKLAAESITTDKFFGNRIRSNNYAYTSGLYSDAGMDIDLLTGNIRAEALRTFDGSTWMKGNITADSGSIGGFTIDSGNLITGSGTSRVGMQSGAGVAFYAGSNTPTAAPLQIHRTGYISCGASGSNRVFIRPYTNGAEIAFQTGINGALISCTADLEINCQTDLILKASSFVEMSSGARYVNVSDQVWIGGNFETNNAATFTVNSNSTRLATAQGREVRIGDAPPTVAANQWFVRIGTITSTYNGVVMEANITNSRVYFAFRGAGSALGSITSNSSGNIAFNTTSDARLKRHVGDFVDGLETLKQVQIHDFEWISSGERAVGPFAQELAEVWPIAVTEGGDDPTENPWQVDNSKLVPLLVAAVKELAQKVEAIGG